MICSLHGDCISYNGFDYLVYGAAWEKRGVRLRLKTDTDVHAQPQPLELGSLGLTSISPATSRQYNPYSLIGHTFSGFKLVCRAYCPRATTIPRGTVCVRRESTVLAPRNICNTTKRDNTFHGNVVFYGVDHFFRSHKMAGFVYGHTQRKCCCNRAYLQSAFP